MGPKRQMSENKKTAINLFSSLVAMFAGIVVNFFLSPYIVKYLGVEANGFTQLANNFIMYASLITIALNSMAGRFISIAHHKGDAESASAYFSSVVLANVVVMFLLLLPFVFVVSYLEVILDISDKHINDAKLLFAMVFLNFFFSQFAGLLNVAMYVTNKVYITSFVNCFVSVVRGVGLFALFYFLPPKMFYVSLVSLILGLLTIPLLILAKQKILPEVRFNFGLVNIKYIVNLIKSGVWNTINQCGNILMTGLDLLLANIFIDATQMGVLATAKVIPSIIIRLATTTNNSFSPNLTIAYAKGDLAGLLRQVRWSMKISSVLISVPTMVFCVLGSEFYQLWMPTLDSLLLLKLSVITVMAFIPLAGTQVLYNVFTTTNKLHWNSVLFIIGGVVNFFIVLILLKTTNLGVFAIAGVSTITTILRNLFFVLPYVAKILNLKWYEFYKDVVVTLLCCATALGCSMPFKSFLHSGTWFSFVLTATLACCLGIAVNTFMVLNKNEKQKLYKMFVKSSG